MEMILKNTDSIICKKWTGKCSKEIEIIGRGSLLWALNKLCLMSLTSLSKSMPAATFGLAVYCNDFGRKSIFLALLHVIRALIVRILSHVFESTTLRKKNHDHAKY